MDSRGQPVENPNPHDLDPSLAATLRSTHAAELRLHTEVGALRKWRHDLIVPWLLTKLPEYVWFLRILDSKGWGPPGCELVLPSNTAPRELVHALRWTWSGHLIAYGAGMEAPVFALGNPQVYLVEREGSLHIGAGSLDILFAFTAAHKIQVNTDLCYSRREQLRAELALIDACEAAQKKHEAPQETP